MLSDRSNIPDDLIERLGALSCGWLEFFRGGYVRANQPDVATDVVLKAICRDELPVKPTGSQVVSRPGEEGLISPGEDGFISMVQTTGIDSCG